MSETRKYYEAYDDRYRQVHGKNLRWSARTPSPIVSQVMSEFKIKPSSSVLEIGCGEGRDAGFLLEQGFRVLATDISPEAVSFCAREYPGFESNFRVLDCIHGVLDQEFDFIYAVAVIHMLVREQDRDGFYGFIRRHLKSRGVALICTMGDGSFERSSDIRTAFDLQERTHGQTGETVYIAGTSCRMVSFGTFEQEITRNGLRILKQGLTAVEPDFPQMMYAVVTR